MKRMIDSTSNEFALAALRSGRGDRPSEVARQRAAIALGIAVSAAAMTTATSASAAGASTVAGASGAQVATGAVATGAVAAGSVGGAGVSTAGFLAGVPLALKAVVLGVAASALVATTVLVQQRPEQPPKATAAPSVVANPAREQATVASRPAVQPTPAAPRVTEPSPPSQAAVEAHAVGTQLPSRETLRASAPAAPAPIQTEPTPSPRPDDLSVGMSLLESARSALASGDSGRALSIVSEYQRQFPSGALAPEAAVLQIEGLAASGAKSEGIAAAERFLSASPDSPHARHVRAILASMRRVPTNP